MVGKKENTREGRKERKQGNKRVRGDDDDDDDEDNNNNNNNNNNDAGSVN